MPPAPPNPLARGTWSARTQPASPLRGGGSPRQRRDGEVIVRNCTCEVRRVPNVMDGGAPPRRARRPRRAVLSGVGCPPLGKTPQSRPAAAPAPLIGEPGGRAPCGTVVRNAAAGRAPCGVAANPLHIATASGWQPQGGTTPIRAQRVLKGKGLIRKKGKTAGVPLLVRSAAA